MVLINGEVNNKLKRLIKHFFQTLYSQIRQSEGRNRRVLKIAGTN